MKILWLGRKTTSSACRFLESAKKSGIAVDICELPELSFVAGNGKWGIQSENKCLTAMYDVLIVRTFYPPFLSDVLTIARMFKEAGKVVIDQSLTDEGYAISKMHDYLLLAKNGLPVPLTWQVYQYANLLELVQYFGFPLVLKGVHGMQGSQTYLIEDIDQLRDRLMNYSLGEFLLQEFLPGEEDYRVFVVGYKALPILVKRRLFLGEFLTNSTATAKFQAGTFEEFPELKLLAEKAAKVLRREIAGIDIRYKGDDPMILEVNRQPAFEDFEIVTNLNITRYILDYAKKTFKNLNEFV